MGTERLANVVITVTTNGGVSTSSLSSAGAILSQSFTTYDAAGRVVQTTDASGLVTNNTYDNVGNRTASTTTVNGVARTTSSVYNVLGQVVSSTDALGNTTQYQYNAAGQTTRTTFADGSTIVDAYDSQGRKVSQTDPRERGARALGLPRWGGMAKVLAAAGREFAQGWRGRIAAEIPRRARRAGWAIVGQGDVAGRGARGRVRWGSTQFSENREQGPTHASAGRRLGRA